MFNPARLEDYSIYYMPRRFIRYICELYLAQTVILGFGFAETFTPQPPGLNLGACYLL